MSLFPFLPLFSSPIRFYGEVYPNMIVPVLFFFFWLLKLVISVFYSYYIMVKLKGIVSDVSLWFMYNTWVCVYSRDIENWLNVVLSFFLLLVNSYCSTLWYPRNPCLNLNIHLKVVLSLLWISSCQYAVLNNIFVCFNCRLSYLSDLFKFEVWLLVILWDN